MSKQSVQEVSKQHDTVKRPHGKLDVRYWRKAIFQPTYTRNGNRQKISHWAAKIQYAGRRETVSLGTANRDAAADKAKALYMRLQSEGWEAALREFKPKSRWSTQAITTVGEFLDAVKNVWSGNTKTLAGYMRAFRQIVAQTFDIDGGNAKYDYRGGGREAWLRRIDRVKLRDLTADRIQKWKVKFLTRAGSDQMKKRSAAISVNSLLRQAKSLFSPDILKFIQLDIPASPFENIKMEPRKSMRYQSDLNVESLIQSAQDELPTEQFKIFLLAIAGGLRRNEIDKLEWTAFDWKRGLLSIRATRYFSPKSEDSTGDVELDEEVLNLFKGYCARASGSFVIDNPNPVRQATYSHYRCANEFEALNKWLRTQGVHGNRPLHTLRKEFGSQVCAKHGIYAASRALRHADIAITSQHYLDKRQPSLPGLGSFLIKPNTIAFPDSSQSQGKAKGRLR